MNIVLIGFMGAGKSVVGKALAENIDYRFIDVDDEIIAKSDYSSDKEIFDKVGEIAFRELETEVIKSLSKASKSVIAPGGGIVMNKLNIDYLKQHAKIVFLKASFETTVIRVKNDRDRPLFHDEEKAKKLFDFRQPLYTQYADGIIETDNKDIETIVSEIIKLP